MVSIKGITIKNVTEFKGHEGESLTQCDVYYKNKKVGFYSQDSWGGEDRLETYGNQSEIDLQGINKLAQEFLNDQIKNGVADSFYAEHKELYDFGNLILEIVTLKEYEKLYKKNCKKGYDTTIIIKKDDFNDKVYGLKNVVKPTMQGIKEQFKIQENINYLFTQPSSFEIK